MNQQAALLLSHGGQHRPIHANNAINIDVKHLLELLGGISFCDADSGEAGVVDNNV
jgi:hypothetical protein